MGSLQLDALDERPAGQAGEAGRPWTLRTLISRRRRRFPWVLSAASVLVVAALISPLALIIIQAVQAGWGQVWSVLDRDFVATLLWNTIRLAFVVTLLSAVIGTVMAWLTERTALPGRRVWAILLIVPIVVPDFVLSWTWSSIFTSVQGLTGAALVMTLHLYPLVYLPMAAAFRAADPGQEEAARILGLSRWAVWLKISVRQARSTLLGGCLLVSLSLMAYYGAFEDLHYQTFTTAIFGELRTQFAPAAASSLSLVLVGRRTGIGPPGRGLAGIGRGVHHLLHFFGCAGRHRPVASRIAARRSLPAPLVFGAGTVHVRHPGHPGCRGRARARLRGQPLPGLPLSEPAAAGRRLHADVLPPRPGRDLILGRPRVAAA